MQQGGGEVGEDGLFVVISALLNGKGGGGEGRRTTYTSSPQRRNSEDVRYRRLFRCARAVVVVSAAGAGAGAGRGGHGRRHAGADAADQVLLEEEVVGLPLAARAHGIAQAGDAGEEDEEAGLVGDHQVPLRVGALGEGAVGGGGAAEEAVFTQGC